MSKRYLLLSFYVVAILTSLPSGLIFAQSIISADVVGDYSQNELTLLTGVVANNGATGYKVRYLTTGSDMQPDTASGFVAVPDGESTKGLLAYQHGTVSDRQSVPSNLSSEGSLALIFAGQGYVTTAADYLGLGESRGFHPYVHAATEASAGIDLLIAGKELAAQHGLESIENIFVCGYSQGGHAAMAMAQALQERPTDDLWITAAAPMSGPYAISTVMSREILTDTTEYFFPAYLAYTILSYQSIYQNLYDSLEQAFKEVFVEDIRLFGNEEIGVSELNQRIITTLQNQGDKVVPKDIFLDTFLEAVLSDTLHPVNLALADNDTYRWVPQFPMRLYYCMADDQVNYRNSLVAEEYMQTNGATDVLAIDLLSTGDHGDCVLPALLATLSFFNEISTPTAIYETEISRLQVVPNPASRRIRVTGFDNQNLVYTLVNHLGQVVQVGQGAEVSELDVSLLPDGMYHITVVDGLHRFGGSFIVQH